MAKDIDQKIEYIQEKMDEISDSVHNIDKSLAVHKSEFIEHSKQDEKMYDELKRMNDILQTNTDSLQEHMHRTDLLETLITRMDARLAPFEQEKISQEAVKKYKEEKFERWIRIGKILTGIVAAITIITTFQIWFK